MTRKHRGVALLIVLAALVVSVTAAAIAASAKTRHALARSSSDADVLCSDLVRSCQAPMRAWLISEAPTLVLPSDCEAPAVEVLHDAWRDGDRPIELRITAWDQCGMIPAPAIHGGHPLAQRVSDHVHDAIRTIPDDWLKTPGLDQFVGAGQAFPELSGTAPLVFGGMDSPGRIEHADETTLGLGGVVATHNAPANSVRRGETPVVININTTPRELLESAMRLAGRGGIEVILDRRDADEPAQIGAIAASDENRNSSIRFVSASPSWAFRIDVRIGPVRRSVWEAWTNTSSEWEVVQRLAITE